MWVKLKKLTKEWWGVQGPGSNMKSWPPLDLEGWWRKCCSVADESCSHGREPFVPQPNSSAVPVEKPATAGTVVRQRGSQETKYPNFSLLPPSDLLPLAKPEARWPKNLVMKTSEVTLTPWKAQIRGLKGREQNLGWGANGEESENMMNPGCPWFRLGELWGYKENC